MAEGEGGVTVPAGLVPVQPLGGAVLDGKNARERGPAEERHQAGGVMAAVGGVGQDEVERPGPEALGIPEGIAAVDGDPVRVVSRRGAAELPARVVDSIRPDTVFAPFHWPGVNALTNDVAMVTPADGPSFGVAPSGTCMWTSMRS